MDATTAATAKPIIITLSGGAATDTDQFNGRAGFLINNIGQIFKINHFSVIQMSTATDWIIPRVFSSNYEVRISRQSGTNHLTGDPRNVWLNLDTDRQWIAECSRFCVESSTNIIDIRHATDGFRNVNSSLLDGAPVMATNTYTIFIEAS